MDYQFLLTPDVESLLAKELLFFNVPLKNNPIKFSEISSYYRTFIKQPHVGRIGGFSYSNTYLANQKTGNYTCLGANITIFGHTHPIERFTSSTLTYLDFPFTKSDTIKLVRNPHFDKMGKLFIGNDVYVGQNVIFAPHIRLKTGCVVAAGSVVTKDVSPYAIVGGNPARILKYRFEEKIIEQLLETRWTEYDIAPMEIRGDIPIENFIEAFYNYRDKGLIKPIVLKNLKEVLDKHGIVYEQV